MFLYQPKLCFSWHFYMHNLLFKITQDPYFFFSKIKIYSLHFIYNTCVKYIKENQGKEFFVVQDTLFSLLLKLFKRQ